MKKILTLILSIFVCFFVSQKIFANESAIPPEEISFAMHYFTILYDYDVTAASYAQKAHNIGTKEGLTDFFNEQETFVNSVIEALNKIQPTTNYTNSYNSVIEGLNLQKEYLKNLSIDLKSGLGFDEAFTINNWGFIIAQKNIQKGIDDFKIILESYSEANQLKILSSTGITEEQLIKDADDCEYVKTLQDSIK